MTNLDQPKGFDVYDDYTSNFTPICKSIVQLQADASFAIDSLLEEQPKEDLNAKIKMMELAHVELNEILQRLENLRDTYSAIVHYK
jgi:hypothetical protein